MDGISLKKAGMRADSLDCPKGGRHAVEEGELSLVVARGGGGVPCLKCGNFVQITRVGGPPPTSGVGFPE